MIKCSPLMKEALEGIDFRYKLDDTLAAIDPKAKMSGKQLEGYLLKRGVSPKEIKQSSMFNDIEPEIVRPKSEWNEILRIKPAHKLNIAESDEGYADIILGSDKYDKPPENYKETIAGIDALKQHKPPEPHFSGEANIYNNISNTRKQEINNRLEDIEYKVINLTDQAWLDGPEGAKLSKLVTEKKELIKELSSGNQEKSLMGWIRTHTDNINGKKTTVLNELQSDWAQTERAGRGTFKSNIEKKIQPIKDKLASDDILQVKEKDFEGLAYNELTEEQQNIRNSIMDFYSREQLLKDIQDIKIVADFPMKPEKFQQFQIVQGIDEAIKNGTNRVSIPIQREGELAGTEGVTKFYESLGSYNSKGELKMFNDKDKPSKTVLSEIKRKLEKQGMKVTINKEDISTIVKTDDLHRLHANDMYEELEDVMIQHFYGDDWNQVSNAIESRNDAAIMEYIDSIQSKVQNTLHSIEVIPPKNKKVPWDIYSLLGAIGLGGLADELKEAKEN